MSVSADQLDLLRGGEGLPAFFRRWPSSASSSPIGAPASSSCNVLSVSYDTIITAGQLSAAGKCGLELSLTR